ncbi:MAG: hypothetical protein GY829_10060, partial [Gammaproteobacteria bacterium]|nr:hypothetical protein [Gammaproteobacteria bacterium]
MKTSKVDMQWQPNINRRQFMVSGLTVGGGFLVGGIIPSVVEGKPASNKEQQIGFFIEILP